MAPPHASLGPGTEPLILRLLEADLTQGPNDSADDIPLWLSRGRGCSGSLSSRVKRPAVVVKGVLDEGCVGGVWRKGMCLLRISVSGKDEREREYGLIDCRMKGFFFGAGQPGSVVPIISLVSGEGGVERVSGRGFEMGKDGGWC